jgi:acyl carrier protein
MDAQHLREQLARFLMDTGRIPGAELAPDAPLITSGLIDSVTLFSLALWIEEAIGEPVDLTQVVLPAQWDSVEKIIAFIDERARRVRTG